MHGPIEDEHKQIMNAIAADLNTLFYGYGFALLVFEQNSTEGRMNYISNSRREDMIVALKELVANLAGNNDDARGTA